MRNKTLTLRKARLKARLTIQELADKSGLTWATIQAIEAGRTPGTFAAKMKLIDALGMSLSLKDIWPETYAEMAERISTPGWAKKNRPRHHRWATFREFFPDLEFQNELVVEKILIAMTPEEISEHIFHSAPIKEEAIEDLNKAAKKYGLEAPEVK
jgi:transcriptional regulator with XRE-family HTH domain